MVNKFLIKHPLITEKSTSLSAIGKYVFLVEQKATSPEIKKSLKAIYNVDVVNVNIINTAPKPKRYGQRINYRSGYKKAMVTLKKGQKLDIMPQ